MVDGEWKMANLPPKRHSKLDLESRLKIYALRQYLPRQQAGIYLFFASREPKPRDGFTPLAYSRFATL